MLLDHKSLDFLASKTYGQASILSGSLSALVALTIFSAALQQRVSLASRDHLAMRVEEVWRQFQASVGVVAAKPMGRRPDGQVSQVRQST